MAYRYGRLHRNDHTFAFSPAKVDVLGGFASSIALAMVALMMIMQSVERLLVPQLIQFDEAIIVAAVGLSVNILSALLLNDHDHHHHSHSHQHDHHHGHHHHHDHQHDHQHGSAHSHEDGIAHSTLAHAADGSPLAHEVESFVVHCGSGATAQRWEHFFQSLPQNVWRVKGFVQSDQSPTLIQYTMGQLEMTPASHASQDALVFIGSQMDRAFLEAEVAMVTR